MFSESVCERERERGMGRGGREKKRKLLIRNKIKIEQIRGENATYPLHLINTAAAWTAASVAVRTFNCRRAQ